MMNSLYSRIMQFREKNRILIGFCLCMILGGMIINCGCVSIPFLSGSETKDNTAQETGYQEPVSQPEMEQPVEEGYEVPPPPEEISTPEPTPTPPISTISDWNPYGVIPLPETAQKRDSILKNPQNNNRAMLNTTSFGSVGLGGFAVGKELNITKGPFSLTYTVHPNITDLTNPNIVWAKITVRDPWQRVMAEDGYNREFSSEETKTITIYREGIHYIVFEGEFVTVDYTLKTGDVVVATPTPVPVGPEEEELWEGG